MTVNHCLNRVQSAAAKRPNIIEYAVAHKLAEGVFQVTAIDEDDAVSDGAASGAVPEEPVALAVSEADASESVEGDEIEESQADREGWGHRPLIRATLPRPEGQTPERKAPDFTFRPGGGKFDANRNGQRHRGGHRQARPAQGHSPSGQGGSRFGGQRGPGQGQGQGGGAARAARQPTGAGRRRGRPGRVRVEGRVQAVAVASAAAADSPSQQLRLHSPHSPHGRFSESTAYRRRRQQAIHRVGIAQITASRGARLVLTYQGRFEEHVNELSQGLDGAARVAVYVTSDSDIEAVFARIDRDFGGLDFVVHGAAFAKREDLSSPFSQTSRDGFAMAMDISAYSLIALTRGALPLMEKRGGGIVTLSYLGSERVFPNYNVMGVAKSALESSVRYLAADVGPRTCASMPSRRARSRRWRPPASPGSRAS
jgi:hypothetical protein